MKLNIEGALVDKRWKHKHGRRVWKWCHSDCERRQGEREIEMRVRGPWNVRSLKRLLVLSLSSGKKHVNVLLLFATRIRTSVIFHRSWVISKNVRCVYHHYNVSPKGPQIPLDQYGIKIHSQWLNDALSDSRLSFFHSCQKYEPKLESLSQSWVVTDAMVIESKNWR